MSRPLRVLHMTPSFAPAYRIGGPVYSLDGLVRALASSGVEVRVLTSDSDGLKRMDVKGGWQDWHGASVRYVRSWFRGMTPVLPLEALRDAVWADVIHVTGVFCAASMQGALTAFSAHRPLVLSPRGCLEPQALAMGSRRLKRYWLRAFSALLSRVDVFHATAESEAASIRECLGPVTVDVVPNGIDAIEAPKDAKEPAGPPVIGSLGRIHPKKRLEKLIAAAALLQARGKEFVVEIAGGVDDEAYKAGLDAAIRESRLEGRVRFLGPVYGEEKRRFYERCRVFALPSDTENFANVVIEALGAGTPVVTSRNTPWEELETTRSGRWVDAVPETIADAIAPYLESWPLSLESGRAGQALVARKYLWSAIAAEMVKSYEHAIRLRRGALVRA